MTGYHRSYTSGRVAAGETDQLWTPRSARPGRVGVILCHGSGNPQAFVDPVQQLSSVKLADGLATAGIPLVAGDFGGQTWGNDTAMSRLDSAWALLKATNPTMRTDKVALLGGSMGGLVAARYSQLHPERVAAVVGLIPLWDLAAFYAENIGGSRVEVGNAWGVVAPAALPASADVATRAPLAAGIPTLAGYSTVDTTVLPAWVLAYTKAVGGQAIITDTTAGHSDAAIGGMPIDTVVQFLTANGA